ncbi:hypothetical protein P3342_013184 [Pyrenophora teres f. teres]|uniref:Uncharacterized protein n=1 Tax=Pyrenophora teres f. teres (strain 0-1) TaxID=861557 RepID=E3RVP9_PYRTT|nr:hypothetical protein PTT_13277 [Pyrenophora teres f. teres 0-1]KAK1919445.1 hypothetical protein P3342_013184 [Pyrenophora teres f. teres]
MRLTILTLALTATTALAAPVLDGAALSATGPFLFPRSGHCNGHAAATKAFQCDSKCSQDFFKGLGCRFFCSQAYC